MIRQDRSGHQGPSPLSAVPSLSYVALVTLLTVLSWGWEVDDA